MSTANLHGSSKKKSTFIGGTANAGRAATEVNVVRKNAKGGVLVTPEELRMAFDFLDVDRTGKVSLVNLKRRLGVFFPNMNIKEYRFLMNNKREISFDDLRELLIDNEIQNFDPVAEAFKAYDTSNEGSISIPKLREVFESFGFEELSDTEIGIILKAADVDGDGAVSMNDFRYMLDMHRASSLSTRTISVRMLLCLRQTLICFFSRCLCYSGGSRDCHSFDFNGCDRKLRSSCGGCEWQRSGG